jgi:hypothetical protein
VDAAIWQEATSGAGDVDLGDAQIVVLKRYGINQEN